MSFEFTKDNLKKAKEILTHYPSEQSQSALLPLLTLAQEQNDNWLSTPALEYVANFLNLAPMRVFEVASFYTMYNLKPVGKYHVQVCGTTPCMLRGAIDIRYACEKHLKIQVGETTDDHLFTLSEVECVGACVNAPVVQINYDVVEDLSPQDIPQVLDLLKKGEPLQAGSVLGRQCSKMLSAKGE